MSIIDPHFTMPGQDMPPQEFLDIKTQQGQINWLAQGLMKINESPEMLQNATASAQMEFANVEEPSASVNYENNNFNFDFKLPNEINNNIEALENALPLSAFSSQTVDDRLDALENPEIWLLIGDSWSDFSESGRTDWSARANAGINFEIVNYAKGGTGFTTHASTPTFQTRLELAISEMTTEQKQRTKAITILGGVNDIRNGATYVEMKTAASSIVKKARQNFPNAVIYLGYNVPAIDYSTASVTQVARECYMMINRLKDDASFFEYDCVFVNTHMASLTHHDSELYTNDLLHLNTEGGRIFGDIIHYAFKGMSWFPTRKDAFNQIADSTAGITLTNLATLEIVNGTVFVCPKVKNTSGNTLAAGTYNFDLKSNNNLAYKWLQAFISTNIYIPLWINGSTAFAGWLNIRNGAQNIQVGVQYDISNNQEKYATPLSFSL